MPCVDTARGISAEQSRHVNAVLCGCGLSVSSCIFAKPVGHQQDFIIVPFANYHYNYEKLRLHQSVLRQSSLHV